MSAHAGVTAAQLPAFALNDEETTALMTTLIDTPSGHLGPWITVVEQIVAARLAPVAALANEWASDPVGGDLWRSDAVDALHATLRTAPTRGISEGN